MKIGTLGFNEVHLAAADVMLGAEMALLHGKRRKAAECAQCVLSLGCDAYYPAARLMLKRCGAKAEKRSVREIEPVMAGE